MCDVADDAVRAGLPQVLHFRLQRARPGAKGACRLILPLDEWCGPLRHRPS